MTIKIADKEFTSRLMVGTGKFSDYETMQKAHEASGAQIVTVAIRRVDSARPGMWASWIISTDNTGFCHNAECCATVDEALRVARLSRAMGINNWIKLEVIPDSKYLRLIPLPLWKQRQSLCKKVSLFCHT